MTESLLRTTSFFNKYLSEQEQNEPVYESRAFENQKWLAVQKFEKLFFNENGLKLNEWVDQGLAVPVKSGPHRTVYRLHLNEETFYLKHLKTADWKAQLRSLFSPAKAMKEFRAAALVRKNDLATIQPVAVGWEKEGRFVKNSYLISKDIADTEPLDVFVLKTLSRMSRAQRSETQRQLAFDLGRLAGSLHRLGFLHEDFHAGNILIRIKAPDIGKLYLIDLHALGTRLPVTASRRRKNLGLLHNFFSHFITNTDRLRFFRSYWQSLTLEEPSLGNKARFVEEIRKTEESCMTVLNNAFRRSDNKWFRPNRRLFIENESRSSSRGLTWLDDDFRQRIEIDPQEILSRIPSDKWKPRSDGIATANWELDLADERIEVDIRRTKSSTTPPNSKRENHWSSLRSCWENGHRLMRRGFECPQPLFLYETRDANLWSYLLIEPLQGVISLGNWWKNQERSNTRNLLRLTHFIEKFHRFGFEFSSDDSLRLTVGYSQSGNRFVITDPSQIRFTHKPQTSKHSSETLTKMLDELVENLAVEHQFSSFTPD